MQMTLIYSIQRKDLPKMEHDLNIEIQKRSLWLKANVEISLNIKNMYNDIQQYLKCKKRNQQHLYKWDSNRHCLPYPISGSDNR